MHGAILYSLGKFLSERHGATTWKRVVKLAHISDPYFVPTQEYPEGALTALLHAASEVTEKPQPELLESFGTFLVPPLLELYGAMVDSSWRTLEFIENTEQTMHRVIRMRTPHAEPPVLATRRSGPDSVTVHYRSPRRLCHLAVGIIHGVAFSYDDTVTIRQAKCMHRGSDHCEIVVRLQNQAAASMPLSTRRSP